MVVGDGGEAGDGVEVGDVVEGDGGEGGGGVRLVDCESVRHSTVAPHKTGDQNAASRPSVSAGTRGQQGM